MSPPPQKTHDGPSAAAFLQHQAETRDNPLIQPAPPSFGLVLSRVIAAAERLELELTHAATNPSSAYRGDADAPCMPSVRLDFGPSDGEKAVEAARLEALRAHINGLRSAQQQCIFELAKAEDKCKDLNKELVNTRLQVTHAKQENTRLRWQLEGKRVENLKSSAAMAFSSAGRAAESAKIANQAREKATFQRQLDEANQLADDLSATLAKDRKEYISKIANLTERAETAEEEAKISRRRIAALEKKVDILSRRAQGEEVEELDVVVATRRASSAMSAVKMFGGSKKAVAMASVNE